MLLLSIAWRSLWRNRRRTIIVIAAVVFALSLTIFRFGLDEGSSKLSIMTAARLSTGFIQIQKIGYIDNPTLQKSFEFNRKIQKAIDDDPRITGSSPRIQADGLLSYKDHSIGAMIMGMSPKTEPSITDFTKKIYEGRFLSMQNSQKAGSTPEIVMGYKLLQNLNAKLGDSVVVLAQGFDGILGNMFIRIVGTFKTGSDEFDRMGAFMSLTDLQNFLGMDNRVNAVAISVRDPNDIDDIVNALNPVLKPIGLVALPWQALLPQLKQTIDFMSAAHIVFFIILLFVVGFGILNAVLMSITERFREFGVMLALGMSQGKLAITVAIEVFCMLLIGIFFGDLIGAGINLYYVNHPISFGGDLAKYLQEWGFPTLIPSSMAPKIFISSTLMISIISIVAALYPLWRLLRLEPLKGIRYT